MKNNIKIQSFTGKNQTTCVVTSLRGVAVFAFRNAEWRLVSFTTPIIGGMVYKAAMDKMDPVISDPEDANILSELYSAFEKWSKRWMWRRSLFHPDRLVIVNHAQKNKCLQVGRTCRI